MKAHQGTQVVYKGDKKARKKKGQQKCSLPFHEDLTTLSIFFFFF